MTLTGRQPNIQCQTVGLDHSSIPDYVSKGDFDANTEGPHENGWGSCHKSALEAEVKAASVKWVGEGTWTPESICFDWDNDSYQVWVCTNTNGSSLANGDSVDLTCAESTEFVCP